MSGPGDGDLQPEAMITRIVHERLQKEDCLRVGDRESVAYRIAEVMVTAKALYTDVLPRLIRENPGEDQQFSLYDELAGLRMSLLHLRDLVTEYDDAFLEAMHHQREEEGVLPLLSDEEDYYKEEDEEEEEDEE